MTKKIIIGILAVFGLFYLLTTIYFNVSDCIGTQIAALTSPDGKYVVNYVEETCKSKPSKIEITLDDQKNSLSTPIFLAFATTTEQIKITWVNSSNLLVKYPSAIHPKITNDYVDNISIKFIKSQ